MNIFVCVRVYKWEFTVESSVRMGLPCREQLTTRAFFVETHTHCEDEPQHSDCCGELLSQGQNSGQSLCVGLSLPKPCSVVSLSVFTDGFGQNSQ